MSAHPPAVLVRQAILEQSKRANLGHIGSALSVADLVTTLYDGVLRLDGPRSEQDRFVLSKGHAALALYCALAVTGRISRAELDTFCDDGTELSGHPEHTFEHVDFTTGSLGHGLSLGTGAALAAKIEGASRRAFVLMSDAECNEGSVWEAAMFAGHHRLGNLVTLLDFNQQQALGHTRDVSDQSRVAERWEAFGWEVHEIDGHDGADLAALLDALDTRPGAPPHMVIAHTTFGYGVDFMERRIEWHYLPMTDEQFVDAMEQVAA
jgi:transketolase